MIEQSSVHLPELVKDIGRPVSIYLVHLSRRSLPGSRANPLGGRQPQSTHSPAAFYESFSAQEATRVSKKIEFVYTPKHGSWLNMVEIELSVLVRQCLERRLADTQSVEREAGAWCEERNRLGTSVEWRFSTEDARIKLRKLYPSIDTWRRTRHSGE